jgi:hypothetical protein
MMAGARPRSGFMGSPQARGRATRLPKRIDQPLRRSARSTVEIESDRLLITGPDGAGRSVVDLGWVRFSARDASATSRFVRELSVECPSGALCFITPPERGAIAPRALGLPPAPSDAIVLDPEVWETLVDWLAGGGRLSGRTVGELARLARVATSSFAVAIGEVAARVAREMTWQRAGPMRSGAADPRALLRPLEEAARDSTRAADALIAALAFGS